MKISGFTIIRNGVIYAYPFKEAILSILPLCDELVINVGKSDDETLDIVKDIKDDRIRVIESNWDMTLEGGKVLSVETNRAMAECSGDWLFYIQSDEILHEKYYDVVREELSKNFHKEKVEGLRFRYKHFYGSYDYVQDNYRNWYIKEVRIVRKHDNIVSWGDAMDFRHRDGSKINAKDIDAEIYHYGWVRPPERLIKKRRDFELLYNKGETAEKNISQYENYDDMGNLKRFTDSHPAVMEKRISESDWDFNARLDEQDPDWIRAVKIFLHPLTKRIRKIF